MKSKKIKSQPKPKHKWKKRPSELKGFDATYYQNHALKDYLRLDYAVPENRVRLYVEIKGQASDSFCVEILNGEIIARSSSGRIRPAEVDLVFQQRMKSFNTIPLKKALAEIKKVFKQESLKVKKAPASLPQAEEKFSLNKLLVQYSIADLFDFILGTILTASAFYFIDMNYTLAGIVSALFGISTGAVDILIRHRKPLFSKILIFLFSGMILYVYGLIY